MAHVRRSLPMTMITCGLALSAASCTPSAPESLTPSTTTLTDEERSRNVGTQDPTAIPPDSTAPPDSSGARGADVESGASVIVTAEGVAGWWDGSRWLAGDTDEPLPLRGGEQFQVLLAGTEPTAAVAAPPDGGCEFNDAPGVPGLIPRTEDWPQTSPIAVSGVADPLPRPVTVSSGQPDVYRAAATEVLADLGVDDDRPELAQVIIADLDGDGSDEVVVTADRWSELIPATPGDYSMTFIRSAREGTVTTTVLAFDHAPVRTYADGEFAINYVHRVSAIADMNGDGTMELALESMYYEGSSTEIYEITPRQRQPQKVLGIGCGV